MRELILKIREVNRGGFFKRGNATFGVIERVDGVETDLGDYFITGYDSTYRKLRNMGREYMSKGYILRGDWDID